MFVSHSPVTFTWLIASITSGRPTSVMAVMCVEVGGKATARETANGYAVVDLFADGSCRASYETFGWNASE